MNILVVEDNETLSATLRELFTREGHVVDVVDNGLSAMDYARQYPYDLIILDIMLPGLDGLSVIRRLREAKLDVPVLMLTALSETSDKIDGLNAGADDYLTKPFDVDELLARANALTRRRGVIVMDRVTYSDLTLELVSGVLYRNDASVQLSRKELAVMRLLMENPQSVITKDLLIAKVWGAESGATDNNIEAYISFLRKKLRLLGSDVIIRNVHGVGYHLEEAV